MTASVETALANYIQLRQELQDIRDHKSVADREVVRLSTAAEAKAQEVIKAKEILTSLIDQITSPVPAQVLK